MVPFPHTPFSLLVGGTGSAVHVRGVGGKLAQLRELRLRLGCQCQTMEWTDHLL